MALVVTSLTTGSSTTDGLSYNTGSVAPAAGSLVLIAFAHRTAAASTISAAVQVTDATFISTIFTPVASVTLDDYNTTKTGRLEVWALQTATFPSDAYNITFSSNRTTIAWAILQVTGVANSGYGTHELDTYGQGLIVQTALGALSSDNTSTTLRPWALSNSNSLLIDIVAHLANTGTTPPTGWTELSDIGSADGLGLETSWRTGFTTTTVLMQPTWTTASGGGQIMLEIADSINQNFFTPDPVSDLYA